MATTLDPVLRDALVKDFRQRVYDATGYIEFPHQAEWRAHTEGFTLTKTVVEERDELPPGCTRYRVQYTDPTRIPDVSRIRLEWRLATQRPLGPVHYAPLLAAYKSGKSDQVGMWATGFAGIPSATVQLIGAEYKTAEHEFNYVVEALLGSQGMRLKKRHLYFDVRNGRLHLELTNGMTFEVKSWERKESLKGHQVTAMLACEAYQLPGLESFTTIAQNLRAERGYYVWASTCDSPWLGELHDLGHGRDPDWACTCGAPGWLNCFTFELRAFLRDCPDVEMLRPYYREYPWLTKIRPHHLKGMMTRERFAIAWLGQLGTFAGRVYDFQRGTRLFTPESHPGLFPDQEVANEA